MKNILVIIIRYKLMTFTSPTAFIRWYSIYKLMNCSQMNKYAIQRAHIQNNWYEYKLYSRNLAKFQKQNVQNISLVLFKFHLSHVLFKKDTDAVRFIREANVILFSIQYLTSIRKFNVSYAISVRSKNFADSSEILAHSSRDSQHSRVVD